MIVSVWAPRAERSVEVVCGERRVGARRGRAGPMVGRRPRTRPRATTTPSRSTAGRRAPIPGRRTSPTASTVRRGWSTTGPSAGPTSGWAGFDLASAVLYELHVGTFSAEGTFDGAIGHLDHLVALGVDAVELLPVVEFPGRRGWGYDGVDLWAPHHAYGGPDGLKRLVDACHARGLGVVLDVVYNHLGPAGNHLAEFGPYFADRHPTNWGPGLNVDGPGSDEVRAFVVDNARMWLRDYHVDGLRLDAVHAIADESATHVLEELAGSVRRPGRRARPDAVADARVRPQRTPVRPPARAGRLRARRRLGRRVAPRPARGAHRRDERLLPGLRLARAAGQGAPPGLGLRRRPTRRTGTGSTAGPPAGLHGAQFVVCRPEPRPGRQPGAGRAARAPGVAGPRAHRRRPAADRRRSCRCCSRARSGRRRRRSCTSPTTRTPSSGGPCPRAGGGSSPPSAGRPRTCPTRRTRPPSPPRCCAGTRSASAEHADVLDWYRALIALRRARPGLAAGPLDDVAVAFDEHARWLVVHRRAAGVSVAANLATSRRTCPLPARSCSPGRTAPSRRPVDAVRLAPDGVVVVATG